MSAATPERNATLVAAAARAAPDLLEALEHLAGLFKALHPNHADWGDYKAASLAIAKARGES